MDEYIVEIDEMHDDAHRDSDGDGRGRRLGGERPRGDALLPNHSEFDNTLNNNIQMLSPAEVRGPQAFNSPLVGVADTGWYSLVTEQEDVKTHHLWQELHDRRAHPAVILARPHRVCACRQSTGGSLIFIAGQVTVNQAGEVVGKGDFAAQAEQVFTNLTNALTAAGADWSRVVKVVQYIPGYNAERHRPVLGEMRRKFMVPDHLPVSILLGIQALANPDFLIEVDAIAAAE